MNVKKLLASAAAALVLTAGVAVGLVSLSNEVRAEPCKKPIACPAIGVFCLPGPGGQERKACRLNPCNCKVTCVPASHPCAN